MVHRTADTARRRLRVEPVHGTVHTVAGAAPSNGPTATEIHHQPRPTHPERLAQCTGEAVSEMERGKRVSGRISECTGDSKSNN